MYRIAAILITLVFVVGSAQAGWFDDTLKNTLQKAGERGIEEAVDATYEGGKGVGKDALQAEQEEEPAAPAYQPQAPAYQQQAPAIKPSPAQGVIEEIDVDSIDMKEGNWKTIMTMQANGFAVPPQTYTTCLSRENIVPQNNEEDNDCHITGLKAKGNTVYWTMECQNDGSTTYTQGEITYHGKTFEGTVIISIHTQEGGNMTMNNTLKGQYLGRCPE